LEAPSRKGLGIMSIFEIEKAEPRSFYNPDVLRAALEEGR
jgi:hypothetical protein